MEGTWHMIDGDGAPMEPAMPLDPIDGVDVEVMRLKPQDGCHLHHRMMRWSLGGMVWMGAWPEGAIRSNRWCDGAAS